jgi:multiple sugar transport system substrate-binding protein
MKKQLFVLAAIVMAASMLLAACGPAATTQAPATAAPATAAPATAAPATAAPATAAPVTSAVQIRWFIGIGTGADPAQVTIEQQVVDDFNATHPDIHLGMEIIPNASARDTLSTEIAAGAGPDIVGPVGWIGSNAFGGQWLDIAPYLQSTNYDSSKFEAALTKMYQTDEGTVGLPFAVYPSAIFYNTKLFQEAGVNPPPANYGDKYTMPDGSEADWTWDTLTTVAQLLTIDSTGANATEAGFDVTKAVQYGFSFGWEGHPNYWGAFQSNGGQILVPGGSMGSYAAQIPDGWKAAWQWVYDGIWGDKPYIPNGAVSGGADFDSGNVFASGKVAMLDNPSWYLCCLTDLTKAGGEFDFGAMPVGRDGAVAGRVDADTFRIWKGTKNPEAAFTVLAYLIDTGIQKLVVGTPDQPPAYGAIPSQTALRGPWLDTQKASFPFVQNWQTLIDGLNYPDVPSAEGYMPNINEAWARIQTFGDLLVNTKGVDVAAEEAKLVTDLGVIFNK